MVHHGADRPDGHAVAHRRAHIDDEGGQPVGAPLCLVAWRGTRQQQHQVGVFRAAGPHLLAVHHVMVAVASGEGAQRGGVGAAGRLGDAERLKAQFAGGDLRQVILFLLGRTVPQDGAHDVHLRVAGRAVAALGVDRLEDRCGGRQWQARAAVFLRDQRGEVASFGQRLDELGGIGAVAVQPAPVFTWEAGAELGNFDANFGMRIGGQGLVHGRLRPGRSRLLRRGPSGVQATGHGAAVARKSR